MINFKERLQRNKRIAQSVEMRGADNTLLKRDGGFASQDAAKMAAREDAKRLAQSERL